MTNRCIIHRKIGIDVGHRVPDHGSKCRNPHGHRYTVEATCAGPVMDQSGNEENGMVLDFGNVKKYMMDLIDAVFDHGFVVYRGDTAMMQMFFPDRSLEKVADEFEAVWNLSITAYCQMLHNGDKVSGLLLPVAKVSDQDPGGMKVIIVNYVPTAENLAKHMFEMLSYPIEEHYDGNIKLVNLRLYETPNGWVDYPGTEYGDR